MLKRIGLALMALAVLVSVNQTSVFADDPVGWESDSFEKKGNPVTEILSSIGISLGLDSVISALGIESPFFEVNFSPSGCELTVSYPHKSGWFQQRRNQSRMKGNAKVQCNSYVPKIKFDVTLFQKRGFVLVYYGDTGRFNRSNVRCGEKGAVGECRFGRFKTSAGGYVKDVDGDKYYAGRSTRLIDNPCKLR